MTWVASRTMELRYTTDGHSWAKMRVFQTGEIVSVVMGRNYYIQFIAPDNASPLSPRCFPRSSSSAQRNNLPRSWRSLLSLPSHLRSFWNTYRLSRFRGFLHSPRPINATASFRTFPRGFSCSRVDYA